MKYFLKSQSNINFKNFVIKNEMINIKYDSNVLRNLDCITINNYGSIFKLNKNFLKIKKLRDEEQSFEITILDEKDTEDIKKTNSSRISKYLLNRLAAYKELTKRRNHLYRLQVVVVVAAHALLLRLLRQ